MSAGNGIKLALLPSVSNTFDPVLEAVTQQLFLTCTTLANSVQDIFFEWAQDGMGAWSKT